MAYTPNNTQVYLAAYSGAMAGIGASGRAPVSQSASSYTTLSAIAGAFAQEFDTIYHLSGNTLDLELIQSLAQNLYSGRYAGNLNPADYDGMAHVLLAMITSADSYVTGQIGPIPAPGGIVYSFLRARGACLIHFNPAIFQTQDVGGSNDGINYEQGDVFMAVAEFDPEGGTMDEWNGPWVVGPIAIDGTAPLSRPPEWPDGATRHPGDIIITLGSEGIFLANSQWQSMGPGSGGTVFLPANTFQIGVNDPGFYPVNLTTGIRFDAGEARIYGPVLSLRSAVSVTLADTDIATTAGYVVTIYPGDWMMGAIYITAYTSAGTIDTDNNGFAVVEITNQQYYEMD